MGFRKFHLFALLVLFWSTSAVAYPTSPAKVDEELLYSNKVTCLTPAEMRNEIEQFFLQTFAIQMTIPKPVIFTFMNFNSIITGSSNFAKKTNGDYLQITVSGNDCRHLIGRDELKLLMCHELGHAAGGAPFSSYIGRQDLASTVSAEGQADFYATSACLPTLFRIEDNTSYLSKLEEFPDLEKACPDTQTDKNERGVCIRIALAAQNFARSTWLTLADEGHLTMPPKTPGELPTFSGHDPTVVSRTKRRDYPSPLCRLETLMAGYNCQALFTSNYTLSPETPVSCAPRVDEAPRPACWYNPNEVEASGL